MNSHICHFGDNKLYSTLADEFDLIDLETNLSYQFIPGDRYLILGKESYQVIVDQGIHLGPRREGFYDLTKMDYLLTHDGSHTVGNPGK